MIKLLEYESVMRVARILSCVCADAPHIIDGALRPHVTSSRQKHRDYWKNLLSHGKPQI